MLAERPGAYILVGNGEGAAGGCEVHNPPTTSTTPPSPMAPESWRRWSRRSWRDPVAVPRERRRPGTLARRAISGLPSRESTAYVSAQPSCPPSRGPSLTRGWPGAPGSGLEMLQGALLVRAVLYFGQRAAGAAGAGGAAVLRAGAAGPAAAPRRHPAAVGGHPDRAAGLRGDPRPRRAGRAAGQPAGGATCRATSATIGHKLSGLKSAGGLLDRVSGAVYAVGHGMVAQEVAQPADPRRPRRRGPPGRRCRSRSAPPTRPRSRCCSGVAEPLLGPLATAGIVDHPGDLHPAVPGGSARPADPPGRRARPAPDHGGDGRRGLSPVPLLPGADRR